MPPARPWAHGRSSVRWQELRSAQREPHRESVEMATSAERMGMMRERRRKRGLRELRLVVPDARSRYVRHRVAAQVARLLQAREDEAVSWIEAVSEFDSADHPLCNVTR